jgi:hypothetical protein
MNKTDFVKIIFPVAEYYGRTLSEMAITLYYEAAKEIDAPVFEHLIKMHLSDPDQGRFFPAFAHVVAQASSEASTRIEAGAEFDSNPMIDGADSFRVKNESIEGRETRKRAFISNVLNDYRNASVVERIAYSDKVPESLKGEMLMRLTDNTIKALEVAHA